MSLESEYRDADQLVADLTTAVLDLIDEGVATPIVLIDGRAASGKSTIADALQRRLFKEGETLPRVVHMDDLYLGWDGLAAGAEYLQRFVLGPIAARKTAHWQMFDWALGERREWREFSGGTPLIIEGCGALNSKSIDLANFSVWLEVPEDVRHKRWLEREGSDEHWAQWAAAELDFYARERSAALAAIRLS